MDTCEQYKLLADSNSSLQQFTYIASHDLQEPLRKIQQFASLIKKRSSDQMGDREAYLEKIQLASKRMSTLIEDLLTYSQISLQKRVTEAVELNNIVADVLSDLDFIIEETDAKIYVSSLPKLNGNRSQLRQLFQNLLSNALKFRKPDAVPIVEIRSQQVLSCEVLELIKGNAVSERYHKIEIIDNGIGFDQKHLARIFEVFQRLHGKSEYPGTGIGLAICERVAANHGGAITAIGTAGSGSVFIIYLPVID